MTTMTEVAPVADEESNDFRLWMKSLGYNAKQVGQAGELIGMASAMAGRTGRSERELAHTERLAMSAATAGLPAWTPETAAELEAMRTIYALFKHEMADVQSGAGAELDAVKTIRAVIRSEALRIATDGRMEKASNPELDQAILALLRASAQSASGH